MCWSEGEKETLAWQLSRLEGEGRYPFHMPGHKRNPAFDWGLPFERDITEITGFDDLHHPRGILKREQERAAALFGSERTYFLVNGSTCGVMTALSACVGRGGKILLARNSHRSAYHALALRGLHPVYLLPVEDEWGQNGDIHPDMVEKALEEEKDIEAVFLTSPTYDGVVSDIQKIAEAAHRHGALLVVDEAHGAHFGFSEYFPESSIRLGADLVVQSLHKTLPCLTQTAVLHVCSERVEPGKVERFLDTYQSSSPSYILMESISRCLSYLEKRGRKDLGSLGRELEEVRGKIRSLRYIHLLEPEGVFDLDASRLFFSAAPGGMGGGELFSILRDRFHLECEMETDLSCLALCSVGDTKEGFERLLEALQAVDREMPLGQQGLRRKPHPLSLPRMSMLPGDAWEREGEKVPLLEAGGRISRSLLCLYPPGIPLLVPGEEISPELAQSLIDLLREGRNLQGLWEDHLVEVVR